MSRKRTRGGETRNIANDPDEIMAIIDAPESQPQNSGADEQDLIFNQSELNQLGATGIEINSEHEEENTVSKIPRLGPVGCTVEESDLEIIDNAESDLESLPDILEDNASATVDAISEFIEKPFISLPPAKQAKPDFKGRGRSLDPVWKEFHFNAKLPLTKVECNHCQTPVSKKVERLKGHLEKYCKNWKKVTVSRRKSVPEPPLQELVEQQIQSVFIEPNPNLLTKAKQTKVDGFVDKVSKKQQDDLSMEIAKYIYATNLPFTHVEHPAFVNLIKKTRPACRVPHRRTIGTSLLDRVHTTAENKRKGELAGKTVTIMQDGWKTRTSEPIIAHSLTTGDKSYFLNAIDAEENVKTARYCAELLVGTINSVQEAGAIVAAVVTDNCKSMEKMQRIISKDFPDIFTYGCHPHLLNLIGKFFTPESTLQKVQTVHVFFRGRDAPWALIKMQGCPRPPITCETRWNAWLVCLEYYLKYHAKFLEVLRNPKAKVSNEVSEILSDSRFYIEVEKAVEYMKPVQVALDSLQKDSASLADGVSAWLKLEVDLNISDAEIVERKYFQKQLNWALQPVGIATFMLHPVYRGKNLNSDLIAEGNLFLSHYNPLYAILASQLKQRDEKYFPQHMFMDQLLSTCSPDTWWQSLQTLGNIDPVSINFFIKLMKLPAGSAEIERRFSVLGNIMTKRRARLGIDKAAKLCVIYKYLAGNTAPSDDGSDWDLPESE